MFCVHIQHYLWKVGSSAIQQLTGQQSHFLLLIPGDNLLYCHWYLGQICRDFIENRSRVFLKDIALDDQWSAASLLLKSTWISQQLTSHKFSVVKQLSSLQYRHLSAKPNIPGMQKRRKIHEMSPTSLRCKKWNHPILLMVNASRCRLWMEDHWTTF